MENLKMGMRNVENWAMELEKKHRRPKRNEKHGKLGDGIRKESLSPKKE